MLLETIISKNEQQEQQEGKDIRSFFYLVKKLSRHKTNN